MKPEFVIDDFGRIYCKSHPKYQLFNALLEEMHKTENWRTSKVYPEVRQLYPIIKNCQTCDHYLQNDCYFSKRDFKKIKLKTKLRLYRCKLCGSAIEEIYNVLHKKISESEKNIKIPLLCRSCDLNLRSDNVKKAFKTQIKEFILLSLGCLILSFIPMFFVFQHPFEKNFPFSIFLFTIFIIFVGSSFLFFMKILKLKFSSKKIKNNKG